MEFLFTNKIASLEVVLLLICVGILVSFLIYELYQYGKRFLEVMYPKRPALTPLESTPSQSSNTSLSVDTGENSDNNPDQSTHKDESSPLPPDTPESPEEEKNQEVLLDNPILYNEDGSPITIAQIPMTPDTKADEIASTSVPETLTSGESQSGIFPENPVPDISEEKIESTDIKADIVPSPDALSVETPDNNVSEVIESSKNPPVSGAKAPLVSQNPPPSIQKISETPESESLEGKKGKKAKSADKIIDILSQVRTLIARGQQEEARALIVSGLALEKDHRDLNLLMATLYERDRAYKKAEYVLKDIALKYPDDTEILSHLATVLALQRKYDVSYELYKKILVIGGENEEILYTLIHLSSELSLADDVLLYARSYLKRFPHNPEILWLYAQSLITAGERKQAVETLIKLKNLTPYNQEIADLIQKLMTEEELAGNFGGEKLG